VADATTFVYEFISGGFSTVLPALSGDGQATTQSIFTSNVVTATAEFFPQYSAGLSKIILILARVLNGSYGSGIAGLQAGMNSLTASITTGSFNSLVLKADAASLAAVGKKISRGGGGGNIFTDIIDFAVGVVKGIVKGAVSVVKKVWKAITGFLSDIRTKENIKYIRTLKNGLNVYSFEYKKEFKEIGGYGKHYGFMAQQVEKIFPNAVTIHSNGYKKINYSLIGI
jgi:hypothetical protein